jgi:rhodanese-related sulfurtransferase
VKEEVQFPHTVTNEELQKKIDDHENLVILDVREPAEYAFNRIPGAISIPLGELEERIKELNPDQEIHVVCRMGNRSDMACQILAEKGFSQVRNVVPGMSGWTGLTEKN